MAAASSGADASLRRRRPRAPRSIRPCTCARCASSVVGAERVVQLQRAAEIEPLDDRRGVDVGEVAVEHVGDRRADQLARDVSAPLSSPSYSSSNLPVIDGSAA